MKTTLIAIVGVLLALNGATAFMVRNFHSAIGWGLALVAFIWLMVEMRKEKVFISFEFENDKK